MRSHLADACRQGAGSGCPGRAPRAAGPTLEEAFIAYLEEATARSRGGAAPAGVGAQPQRTARSLAAFQFSAGSWPMRRERHGDPARPDPARLRPARPPPADDHLGYGITFDVENLSFAVFDRDQRREPAVLESSAGSRYLQATTADAQPNEIDQRLRSWLRLAIEIPPAFGRDLRGRRPEMGVWLDGAMPFRAENGARLCRWHRAQANAHDQARRAVGSLCRRTRSRSKRGSGTIRNSGAPWRSRPAPS